MNLHCPSKMAWNIAKCDDQNGFTPILPGVTWLLSFVRFSGTCFSLWLSKNGFTSSPPE